jgi:hypothetical protein
MMNSAMRLLELPGFVDPRLGACSLWGARKFFFLQIRSEAFYYQPLL